MTKPKVLAISYLFPNRNQPNHGIFVLNRLKALSKYVDVTVINPIPWSPLHGVLKRYSHYKNIPQQDNIDGLVVYHPRYFSIPKYCKGIEGKAYLKALAPLVDKIHREDGFDIIDMHWTFPDLPAGIPLSEKYGVPGIVTLRGMEAFHFQDQDAREHIVKDGMQKVDRVIALSNELKHYGDMASGNSEKSVVIRNGVDTDNFYYLDKAACRAELGIKQNELFIVSVGSLIHRKGFDIIIKALAALNGTDYEHCRLYIIGSQGAEGDYRAELHQLIDQLGMKDRVVFVGQVKNADLKKWYNAADIFCLASRGEGSPNVLTEALACGCPAITTDVGSAKEIIESEDSLGICVAPDSVSELTAALLQISGGPWDRAQQSLIFSTYNWDWCARQVLPVYNSVLAEDKQISNTQLETGGFE